MKKLVAFLTLFAVYLPAIVLGQKLGDIPGTNYNIFNLVFGAELPEDMLTTEKVLQYLLFPFLAIVVIMYGILSELRIFRRHNWINGLIALLIAFMASSTGYLLIFTHWIIGVGGGLAGIIVFTVLLFVGIFLWGGSTIWVRWRKPGRSIGGAFEKFQEEQALLAEIQEIKDRLLLTPSGTRESEMLTERLKELANELKRRRTELT